jgi:hypothetical protein
LETHCDSWILPNSNAVTNRVAGPDPAEVPRSNSADSLFDRSAAGGPHREVQADRGDPWVLRLMDIRSAIFAINAIRIQKAFAAEFIDGEADYVLARKGNQEKLRRWSSTTSTSNSRASWKVPARTWIHAEPGSRDSEAGRSEPQTQPEPLAECRARRRPQYRSGVLCSDKSFDNRDLTEKRQESLKKKRRKS